MYSGCVQDQVGMFMVIISSHDACSKILPYNIKGVWSHLGDMPTRFCVLVANLCHHMCLLQRLEIEGV